MVLDGSNCGNRFLLDLSIEPEHLDKLFCIVYSCFPLTKKNQLDLHLSLQSSYEGMTDQAMRPWLFYSLITLACWGLWAFLPKLAVNHMAPRSALLWEVLGGMSVGAVVLFITGSEIQSNIKGALPSFFTGVAGYLGLFSFLYALQVGKVSVTSSLTAVYPVITLFLAMIILKEKITLLQWTGILFAVLSVILISYEQ